MTAITAPAETGEQITIPVWTWAVLAIGIFLAYVMLQENGLIMSNWMTIHEFFHDGRHALGFPCH